MNLSFSKHWADGNPNYFVGKIWSGILRKDNSTPRKNLSRKLYEQYYNTASGMYFSRKVKEHPNDLFGDFGIEIDYATDLHPKIHTLREDKKDRWKEGMKIHPIINNRAANRFQFAPTMICYSTQEVILYNNSEFKGISIDGYALYHSEGNIGFYQKTIEFVKNDGFDDIDSFFKYFFPNNKEGEINLKLIHWTPLKY